MQKVQTTIIPWPIKEEKPKIPAVERWRNPIAPQARGTYVTPTGQRCALGQLLPSLGIGDDIDNSNAELLSDEWGISDEHENKGVLCPHCEQKGFSSRMSAGDDLVIHLNDTHELSLAKIADYAEQYPERFFLEEKLQEWGIR